jgi:hypothetical protein
MPWEVDELPAPFDPEDWLDIVLSPEDTKTWFLNTLLSGGRLVMTRYGDGEAWMMRERGKYHPEKQAILGPLMRQSIAAKAHGHIPCILRAKQKNRDKTDTWWSNMIHQMYWGQRLRYGCAHVFTDDFKDDQALLLELFCRKTLIVTSHPELVSQIADKYSHIGYYEIGSHHLWPHQEQYTQDILKLVEKEGYESVLCSGGPTFKVIIPRMAEHCGAHLVDLGCTINALLYPFAPEVVRKWNMSWIRSAQPQIKAADFYKQMEERV